MLPPVRAALSSNTEVQNLAPAAAARLSLAVAAPAPTVDSEPSAPISGGRMDALSLSAQLKLAQSFSIFAETIGKVLNMPRGENEALVDYATRLSEAVRSLNPGERMAIERLLNQIVKGVTLRLLAEILNNPAGPDAARLAAYIEAASAGERDLAAKAVVSSYRQNGSAESTAGGNPARLPAANATQTASAPAAAGTAGAAAAGTNAAAAAPATAPSPASPTTSLQPAMQNGEQPPASEQLEGEPSAQAAKREAKPAGQDNRAERPTAGSTQASPAASGAGAAARGQTPQIVPSAISPRAPGQAAGIFQASGAAASSSSDAEALPLRARLDEKAATRGEDNRTREPRHAETGMRTPSGPSADGRAGLSNARLMLAELASWMTGVAAGSEPPAGATAKPAAATRPAQNEQAVLQEDTPAPEGAGKQAPSATLNSDASESPTISRAAESPPREGAAALQTDVTDLLDRQMAMLGGGLPQAAREGVPLPYVAYPPGEQEPEREERKTRAIAEIGDEEGDAPAQDHGFHQDQQEQDGQDGGGEEGPDKGTAEGREAVTAAEPEQPDEDEGRPNDLYWRMAGWA